MEKIILVTDNDKNKKDIEKIITNNSLELKIVTGLYELEELIKNEIAGIYLFDCESQEIDIISLLRSTKLMIQSKDMRTIALFSEKNTDYDVLKYANEFITKPIDEQLFISKINSNLQLCKTFNLLSKNNNDLAKSLYQLNVLYNTSTQLAGSLDKTRLTEIMTDGLDQSLSLALSYALIFNEINDIKLIIKSVYPISTRLEKAIKLRALLNYKNLFSLNPSIENIEVIKSTKDNLGEYDLNLFGYDNLFAPINIKNKFYGIIEVFREGDFTQEDTKCFTTLVKQVSLPLESAILYEEIKDTNIKLEKLERLKSEFISIVSHELRTPLTSINSALDIILKGAAGDINETMEKFLNLAKRNVTRLSAIIYDLLDLSKIEAGKMSFNFEKTNINLSVELVKNALESWANEQKITIETKTDKNLDLVYIDPQRIEQVITNLVSNAIKFTKENGKVEITTSKISANEIRKNPFFEELPKEMSENYVKIAVKDNGIGIAKENWSKVFEQFKQIENPSVRKVGGSGLGLPIAKRLTDAHKGFIWLESEINKGTTFYLAIPIMDAREIFLHSLEQEIQKSKQEHTNISLIGLVERKKEGKSLIEEIQEEDIIRKTATYKEYMYEADDKRYFCSYATDIDSFVYDFQIRKLETFIQTKEKENNECDIMFSSALYPQDGENMEDLINKLTRFSKGG